MFRLIASFCAVSSKGAKNTRHFLRDKLPACTGRLLSNVMGVAKRASPKQHVMACMLRFRHSTAHRLENFGAAQLRNQQPEGVAAGGSVSSDIAAGSCSTLDDAGQLKFP
jgi:hypothetical protein